MEEYISEGKGSFLVDPGPSLLYTKQKLAEQGASCAVVDLSSVDVPKQTLQFPESGWGLSGRKYRFLQRQK